MLVTAVAIVTLTSTAPAALRSTGTMMRDSVHDFASLIYWSMKDRAPLPFDRHVLDDWAGALDEPKAGRFGLEQAQAQPGALLDFATPEDRAGVDDVTAARRGFRRRLVETPGIVATAGDGERVDASIHVVGVPYKLTSKTDEHFARLRNDMVTPDGHELLSGVDVWRHAKELALGFHSIWDPRPPREWLEPRKAWGAFVRAYLARSRKLDSPEQVEQAVLAGELDDSGKLAAWLAVKDTYVPNVVEVWHDDSVVQLAANWAKRPGIVWTEHTFFAARLAQVTGLPYYGAKGLSASGEYVEDSTSPTIIASIDANRDGKNLQHKWSRNLFVSTPEGPDVWQQAIARTHRPGQRADTVTVDVLVGCREHVSAWRRAVAGTHAIRDTVGGTPKLLLADVSYPDDAEIARYVGARW